MAPSCFSRSQLHKLSIRHAAGFRKSCDVSIVGVLWSGLIVCRFRFRFRFRFHSCSSPPSPFIPPLTTKLRRNPTSCNTPAVMGKIKSWFDLNHNRITCGDLSKKIDLETFDLIWICFEFLWFDLWFGQITNFSHLGQWATSYDDIWWYTVDSNHNH